MGARVAEDLVRSGWRAPPMRLRVDLHGVSAFGPGEAHSLLRWEWIEQIQAGQAVVVTGSGTEISLPAGAFGLDPPALAALLEQARAIDCRGEVIGRLAQGATGGRRARRLRG